MPIKERRPTAYSGDEPYMFVSYCRKDSASKDEIVRCLERNRYRVWYDEGLIPAQDWDEGVAPKVMTCTFFLALISKNYTESRNCREELRFAWEMKRPCLLIYLEKDAKLSPGLQMHFSAPQFLRRWEYDTVEEMLQRAARNPDFERCCEAETGTEEDGSARTEPTAPSAPPAAAKEPPRTQRFSPVTDFIYQSDDKGVTVTNYIGSDKTVVVPAEVDGKPVRCIGRKAFEYCSSLTSITLPDGITSIGDEAFRSCTGLISITLPDSVTSIGDLAFRRCTGLTSITLPDGVTSIGVGAFDGCTGLTSITIPGGVTSIGVGAFEACDKLEEILVSDFHPAFRTANGVLFSCDMTALIAYPCGKRGKRYIIPDCVTSIGGSAFNGCTGLTSITLPDSVTSIGDGAFGGCYSLRDVYYSGSRQQWAAVKMDRYEKLALKKAAIHFHFDN